MFVIEVEGTLAALRDLRRWFRVFGFFMEFSVCAVVRKAGGKPVFGNCIVAAVNRAAAKIFTEYLASAVYGRVKQDPKLIPNPVSCRVGGGISFAACTVCHHASGNRIV